MGRTLGPVTSPGPSDSARQQGEYLVTILYFRPSSILRQCWPLRLYHFRDRVKTLPTRLIPLLLCISTTNSEGYEVYNFGLAYWPGMINTKELNIKRRL